MLSVACAWGKDKHGPNTAGPVVFTRVGSKPGCGQISPSQMWCRGADLLKPELQAGEAELGVTKSGSI